MQRLLGHFMNNVMEYMAYEDEKKYLTQNYGCKKTTIELCKQLRQYRNDIAPQPRLEDLIRFHYRPCDTRCEYYMSFDDALPILKHSVLEMGIIMTCQKLYVVSILYITEGRFPTEMEFLLYQANLQLNDAIQQFHTFQYEFEQGLREGIQEQKQDNLHRIPNPYLLTKTLEQDCCMCQESLCKDQSVITLPCFHTFHTSFQNKNGECVGIEKWLQTSNLCPLCKQSI
jgi:hypothetical protein